MRVVAPPPKSVAVEAAQAVLQSLGFSDAYEAFVALDEQATNAVSMAELRKGLRVLKIEQLDEVIDTLDGLLETIARDGARIALLGYPDFPDEPRWELAGEEMMTRYAALAAEHDALFIDLRPVIHAGTPELFADEVHPTVEGAEVIGAEIARVLREAGA